MSLLAYSGTHIVFVLRGAAHTSVVLCIIFYLSVYMRVCMYMFACVYVCEWVSMRVHVYLLCECMCERVHVHVNIYWCAIYASILWA